MLYLVIGFKHLSKNEMRGLSYLGSSQCHETELPPSKFLETVSDLFPTSKERPKLRTIAIKVAMRSKICDLVKHKNKLSCVKVF